MREDGKLDYLELPAGQTDLIQRFYKRAFGWSFTDYGPTYTSYSEGLDGGFQADPEERPRAPLPVLYATDLEAMQDRVRAAGGAIVRPIFTFPGGRRFHFRDPSGNELAAWSDT